MNLVVFDVDGTLLNNHAVEDACFAQALRESLGLPDLNANWAAYPHVTDYGIADEAYRLVHGGSMPHAARDDAIHGFVALLKAEVA